jgi:P-type Ca2+ transporter type 2C
MNGNLVTIIKDGRLILTDEGNLCKGDLVLIQAGDLVPADLKLVEVVGLETDEFDITGEIMPVIKKVDEQDNLLYMGSRITRGTGKGVVVATGEQTEFGKVLKQRWELNKPYKLNIFEKTSLGIISLLLPAFIVLFARGKNVFAMIALVLLVSFILILLQNDEFFKYILISNEQKKFEQINIQIRDPKALEWMREIDVICFDKTGVLTTRHMDVKNVYYADRAQDSSPPRNIGSPPQHINIACALCNDVLFLEKIDLANPIDKALIAFAQYNGINLDELHTQYKRVYDQPFNSENRYMACGFEREGNEVYYFIKGDPGVIVNICTHYMTSTGDIRKVDWNFFSNNASNIDTINQNGDTVIALASSSEISEHPPAKLTFLCLLQLQNSLQPGTREMIRNISEKRIRSILLTGDRAETAARIGAECGITKNPRIYLTGRTIQYMALSEVARQSAYCSVFARLLPSQKAALIRMFQQEGHSIAMIGDGPNDGIALKVADIGISFIKNSSPIARRVSKILIHELADVLRLIEGSDRLNRRIGNLEIIRLLIIAGLLLSIYAYIFAAYYY